LNADVRERDSNAEEVWQLNKTLSITQSPASDTIFEFGKGIEKKKTRKK
jgi:hypothetical protein